MKPPGSLTALRASIDGAWLPPSDEANRRWDGSLVTDRLCAALLLAETPAGIRWAKSELLGTGEIPLVLDVHLLRWDALDFQLIFFCGSGWIQDLIVRASSRSYRPECHPPTALDAGRPFTLFSSRETDPVAKLSLLLLARDDLRAGRSGVWRPRKGYEALLPSELHPALFGTRTGSVAITRSGP